jgi:hypothetical protein
LSLRQGGGKFGPLQTERETLFMARSCGDCNLCCKIPGVGALQKKNLTWCSHCDIGKGCRIYETRPQECRDFRCLWLDDETLPPEFAPRRAHFVSFRTGPHVVSECDVAARNIHRDTKYAALFKRLAADLEPHRGFVSVCYGEHMIAITPRETYDLGKTRRTHMINVAYDPALHIIATITVEKI